MKSLPRKNEKARNIKRSMMNCSKSINFQKHFPKLQSRSQFEKENCPIDESSQLRNSNTSLFNRLNPSYLTKSKENKSKHRVAQKKFLKTHGSEFNDQRVKGKLDQLAK